MATVNNPELENLAAWNMPAANYEKVQSEPPARKSRTRPAKSNNCDIRPYAATNEQVMSELRSLNLTIIEGDEHGIS